MVCVMEIESYPDLQQSGCVQAGDGGEEGQESHHSHYSSTCPRREAPWNRGVSFLLPLRYTRIISSIPVFGYFWLGTNKQEKVQIGPFRLNETTGRLLAEVPFVPPEDQ